MNHTKQAINFVASLKSFLAAEQEAGISPEVQMICLVRMGAVFAIDSGSTPQDFARFAEREFKNVPLARKRPDNVIEFPKEGEKP